MARKLRGTLEVIPQIKGVLTSRETLRGTIGAFGSLDGEIVNPSMIYVYDYGRLDNKPSINEVMLIDDKSLEDLNVLPMTNSEIEEIFDW